jgi:hypothetical protein
MPTRGPVSTYRPPVASIKPTFKPTVMPTRGPVSTYRPPSGGGRPVTTYRP